MKWLRILGRLALGCISLIVITFFGLFIFGPRFPVVVEKLLTGWWRFLHRNIPSVTVNWTLIITGVLCSLVILVMGHLLLRFLSRHFQSLHSERVRPWPWRRTLSLYCVMWLLFTIAFGAAGVFRHSSWLAAYDGPWHQVRRYEYSELQQASLVMQMLLQEHNNDPIEIRKALLTNKTDDPRRVVFWEEYNVMLYEKNGEISAFVIAPREIPNRRPPSRFAVYESAVEQEIKPWIQLEATIAALDAKFPAKLK